MTLLKRSWSLLMRHCAFDSSSRFFLPNPVRVDGWVENLAFDRLRVELQKRLEGETDGGLLFTPGGLLYGTKLQRGPLAFWKLCFSPLQTVAVYEPSEGRVGQTLRQRELESLKIKTNYSDFWRSSNTWNKSRRMTLPGFQFLLWEAAELRKRTPAGPGLHSSWNDFYCHLLVRFTMCEREFMNRTPSVFSSASCADSMDLFAFIVVVQKLLLVSGQSLGRL